MEVSGVGNSMPHARGIGVEELQSQVEKSFACSQLKQLQAMV